MWRREGEVEQFNFQFYFEREKVKKNIFGAWQAFFLGCDLSWEGGDILPKKENHFGSAVSKILRYTQTSRQTTSYFYVRVQVVFWTLYGKKYFLKSSVYAKC